MHSDPPDDIVEADDAVPSQPTAHAFTAEEIEQHKEATGGLNWDDEY